MSWTGDVGRLGRISMRERALLVEALLWLAVWRLAVVLLPFRWLTAALRLTEAQDTATSDASATIAGKRIGWAVESAAAHTPWQSTCLVQSLTGYVMLRRHGEAGTVYLGVAKDEAGDIVAHSWLRCGRSVITGRRGYESFSVIAAYRARASTAEAERSWS